MRVLAVLVALSITAPAHAAPAGWFDAARDGDVVALRNLAGKHPRYIVDDVDDRGYSALILAAYHDRPDVVRWLLAHGASTCTTDTRGFTALMGAVFRGHDRIVTALARKKCGANYVTPSGQTPLMLAALFNRLAIASRLLAAGADRARVDSMGNTARSLAAAQGNEGIVQLLTAPAR